MSTLNVKKVLNNNVLIAVHENYGEVVLIGKGIGFNRKKGDPIQNDIAEKMFVLKGEKEQEQYKNLLPFLNDDMSNVIISAIELIRKRTNSFLNEHIHIALTDHILFAINRLMRGMEIRNPFLVETRTLYPFEYEIAREVVSMINEMTDVHLARRGSGIHCPSYSQCHDEQGSFRSESAFPVDQSSNRDDRTTAGR